MWGWCIRTRLLSRLYSGSMIKAVLLLRMDAPHVPRGWIQISCSESFRMLSVGRATLWQCVLRAVHCVMASSLTLQEILVHSSLHFSPLALPEMLFLLVHSGCPGFWINLSLNGYNIQFGENASSIGNEGVKLERKLAPPFPHPDQDTYSCWD